MLKSILNLIIVLSLLLTPCVIAAEFGADANRDDMMRVMNAATPDEGSVDPGKMVQPGHHCWCEHLTFAKLETSRHDIDNRRDSPFVGDDAIKASAVVPPLLEPPSV